ALAGRALGPPGGADPRRPAGRGRAAAASSAAPGPGPGRRPARPSPPEGPGAQAQGPRPRASARGRGQGRAPARPGPPGGLGPGARPRGEEPAVTRPLLALLALAAALPALAQADAGGAARVWEGLSAEQRELVLRNYERFKALPAPE